MHIVGLRQVQLLPDSFCCGAVHGAKLVHSLAFSVFIFIQLFFLFSLAEQLSTVGSVFTYEYKDLDTPARLHH